MTIFFRICIKIRIQEITRVNKAFKSLYNLLIYDLFFASAIRGKVCGHLQVPDTFMFPDLTYYGLCGLLPGFRGTVERPELFTKEIGKTNAEKNYHNRCNRLNRL